MEKNKTMDAPHPILTHVQIHYKIRRIAYQLYETYCSEQTLVVAGISENGFIFAQRLQDILETISPLKIELCQVWIDKKQPLSPVRTSLSKERYAGKALVLVDDVLNSGATLMYGVKHFLETPLKDFKTAVLVDRSHKKYPVKADFKGISLSTSLQEHITVVLGEQGDGAYVN